MIQQIVLITLITTLRALAEPPITGYGNQRGALNGGSSNQYGPPPLSGLRNQYGLPNNGKSGHYTQNGGSGSQYDGNSAFRPSQDLFGTGDRAIKYGPPSSARGGYSGSGGTATNRYTATSTGVENYRPSSADSYQGGSSYGASNSNGGYVGGGGYNNGNGAAGGYNSQELGSHGNGYGSNEDDPYAEPANYEFSYEVNAPEYGVKFGHKESRQGEAANGVYHVLLPDGRTQIVEYEADEEGYKPRISYQEPPSGSGGIGGGNGFGSGGGNGFGAGGSNGFGPGGAAGYASNGAGGANGYSFGGTTSGGGYGASNGGAGNRNGGGYYNSRSDVGGYNLLNPSSNGYSKSDHFENGETDEDDQLSDSYSDSANRFGYEKQSSTSGLLPGGAAGYSNYRNTQNLDSSRANGY